MLIAGVIQKDALGRLVVAETGTPHFNAGTPVTNLRELLISSASGVSFHAGLLYDVNQYLVVIDGGIIATTTPDSFGIDSVGRLCVAYDGTPVTFVAGIPFDTDGRVCLVGSAVCVVPLFTMDTPDPPSGAAPLFVQFGVTYVSGTATFTYAWDFGDGNTSALQNPLHEYAVAGDYVAEVTITNACGFLMLTADIVSVGSFDILQEIGDNILTELGDNLVQENGSVGSGSYVLNYVAPETDADGAPAASITGFMVYWSTNPLDRESASSNSFVATPTLTYTITGLAVGTWYAWVSAFSAAGESDVSPPVEFVIV